MRCRSASTAHLPCPLTDHGHPDPYRGRGRRIEHRHRRRCADAEVSGLTGQRQKALTIGAVCKALAQEFPDISISKIRYLEDQKLLTPRRTPGGYRLYTQGDVARLRTILRMQRDEFLPLRVIRQELAAGRAVEGPDWGWAGFPMPASLGARESGPSGVASV